MFKEAFLCGLGLALDMSGSHYLQQAPPSSGQERIGHYWVSVGGFIGQAAKSEGPRIEKEGKQLRLNLGE